ncbi:DUF2975 domain-containing protein [Cellulosimicrobium funkei]
MIGVCVWPLLTFVRRGAVFTERSFRPVDVVIGAVLCASAMVLSFALLLAPGDAAPPTRVSTAIWGGAPTSGASGPTSRSSTAYP